MLFPLRIWSCWKMSLNEWIWLAHWHWSSRDRHRVNKKTECIGRILRSFESHWCAGSGPQKRTSERDGECKVCSCLPVSDWKLAGEGSQDANVLVEYVSGRPDSKSAKNIVWVILAGNVCVCPWTVKRHRPSIGISIYQFKVSWCVLAKVYFISLLYYPFSLSR
jgi:hypothetical protein